MKNNGKILIIFNEILKKNFKDIIFYSFEIIKIFILLTK